MDDRFQQLLIVRAMEFDLQEMGARLREAREAEGVSQEVIGEAIGVTKGMVSQYELGKSPISYEGLTKLSNRWGRPVTWFMYGQEEGWRIMSREEYEVVVKTSALDPQLRKFVLLGIEIAHRARGQLPSSILAEPTLENWLEYAKTLYSASQRDS